MRGRVRGRSRHEPGRCHRPQGAPHLFRLPDCLRGRLGLSPPDRPAVVPGHRDREQPQHADAARAGEPAGAEPQRTRLPPRVLQHGRDPAPSRADPDHAPARRGEKAQDDGAARDLAGHDHRDRRGEVRGGPDGLRRPAGAERGRPSRPGPLRRVPLAPHPDRVPGRPPYGWVVPERGAVGVQPDGKSDHRRDSEFRGPAPVLALRLGRAGVRRHHPRQGPVLPLPARSLRTSRQGIGRDEGPGRFRRRHRLHPLPDAPGDRIAAVAVMTELFREFSTRRATRLGLNSVLIVVLMGTILGILTFLAARHSVRWDFSETKRFTLAPQTARLLRELPREVKVTVFTSDQSPGRLAYRDLIDSYRAHTPKLTVEFVDPEKKPGVARQYGITRPDTAVLESGKQETRITSHSEQELTKPVVNTYGAHEITQDLGQVFTMFPHARPVSFLDSKGNEWVFHPLAKSSPRSWARADTPPDRTTQTRDFNPEKDTQGPLTLAALVVARANPSENARQPAVLLVGDSDFASNAFLDFSGNTDFILHAVAWLAEEKDLVTIAPKDTTLGTLLLTATQSNALFALQVLGLPGFFLLAGFAVWRHRRRL